MAQLATVSAAVIDGEISDALNSEDGRADCWTFETKNTTYQIYRWCTGGVWVGGVCAKGSKEMCAEICDGQFSATIADKETKSLAKELQAAFDEQAASWVEDELADTDEEEEFSDEEIEHEQETEISRAESVESDDEVSVGQAETEDEPTVSAPVAAQETVVTRVEPTADVVEEAEAPAKQPKRSTRRKASEAAPKAAETPKRSSRKKAASNAAVADSDNVSTASAALSAATSEPLPGDLTKMKVADLRQELKARQQTSSGLKKDLVARLQDVLKQDIGQVA